MTIFSYLEILKLNQDKISRLRNRDFIQLEKKLNSKSVFNKAIDKKEISGFIKTLKYYQREIETLYKPPFYGLRKIIENPDRAHNFVQKQPIDSLVTPKLIQFIELHCTVNIDAYSEFCMANNNMGSLNSLLSYKLVLSPYLIQKIELNLKKYLVELEGYLNGNLNTNFETVEVFKNRHFYGALGKLDNPEIENYILAIQENIKNQFIYRSYTNSTLDIVSSINDYETKNSKIRENKIFLSQKKEEILVTETIEKKNKLQSKTNTRSTSTRKYNKSYSSKGDWKIVISIILMIITIIRFCARNKQSSSNVNNYYQQQEQQIKAPDYEIKELQKKLIYIHTTKEITNTQKEEFNYSRMKFISKNKKYAFPGPHTLIKNTTNKKVVFFYNNDFGGFKYKLMEPNSEVTLTLRYTYFLVFKGDDPYYTVYTDELGESKVGILFNEFDENDMKLLNTLYTNDIQKLRKQSVVIISEDSVIINEKS